MTGPQRHRVEGTVSFAGEPVPTGTIYFEADASRGNHGPIGLASIEDGRFVTAPNQGPLAGPVKVRIVGYPAADPNVEVQWPLFPEYSTTVELVAGHLPYRFDFEVPPVKRSR